MAANAATARIARSRGILGTYHNRVRIRACRRNETRPAIVAAFVVLGFLFLAPGYVRPDSVAVFAYLRSAVLDGDFAFFNEWAGMGLVRGGVTMFAEVTPAGALANHWWIGTSILSAPPYLAAHLIGGPRDGFFGLYAAVLGWTNVVFAAWAMSIASGFTW